MANKPETTKKPTFAELSKLAPADLFKLGTKIVRVDAAITKAKTALTDSMQFFAKVVAAMKRAYVERLNKREIPPDTTFKKYFEQNAGGALPGRVLALAELFNALVLTLDANGKPLLSEECFDAAAVDWLEKSNAIIKRAQKDHGDAWKTSDEVLDVVNALSKPGDALKQIKEIRERQVGEKAEKDETAAVTLTVGRAVEFLKAAIQGASKMKEEEAYALYADTVVLTDLWSESGLSDDKINEFAAKYDKSVNAGVDPKIEIKDAPAEAPTMEVPAEVAA